MKKFFLTIFALFFPSVSWGDSNVATQPNALIITCVDKGDINCKLPSDNTLTPLKNCAELDNDPLYTKGVLYLDYTNTNNCGDHEKISNYIETTKCPAYHMATIAQNKAGNTKLVLICITNPNVVINYTDERTDTWSYAQKKCVGSHGEWKNGECDCSKLSGTKNINNECICTKNPNQKYYNKLWSGCETLADGVFRAGSTSEKLTGFGDFSLSSINRANSCSPSGGTWGGKGNNVCKCNPRLNLEPDDSAYFCNCKAGYDYKNPLAKTDGCELINNIQGYYNNPSGATETANEEQPTITNTDPQKNCTDTGGTDYDATNKKCICPADKFLEEYKYEDKYSICRCMNGYHRASEPDENGKYTATGKCVYAPEIQTKIKRDDMAMQRDAEDAYRNEYDNAQSWANKGTTALSTLATGEGAMMAARAIAEKIADDDAEEKMSEYVSTMKCEYGGGQSVNLGDTETLPGGNELANYYTEYKQLADKLKATKAALNLRPGIEAEVLYDRAETGLYQYQTAERQSGGFTSLSRALMNPEGADAEQWNAQRAETNRDLLVGGALATVGLAGSYIANRAINKDHVKKYKELEEKFNKIEQELLNKYPEVFVPETKEETKEEVVKEEIISPAPIQAAQIDQNKSEKLPPISGEAFETGSIELNETGKTAVEEAATRIADLFTKYGIKSITVTATGYTDPQTISAQTATNLTNEYQTLFGDLPASYNGKIDENSELSEVRAKVVLKSLTDNLNNRGINTTPNSVAIGGGIPAGCERGTIKKQDYKTCRKINITIDYTYTETTVTE